MATLHHQIVYRLQNHALDLSLPNSTSDALVAISNRADDTSIIQIPRQIPKEELAQIMPMEWIRKLDDDEDDYSPPQPVSSRRSTRRWQPPPPPKKSSKDMSLAELMLETGHHDLVEKYFPNATPSTPPEPYSQPPHSLTAPCIAMMHAYEHDFPPLERKYDQNTRVPSKPFVTPNTVDAQDCTSSLTSCLKKSRTYTSNIDNKLKKLDAELRAFIDRGYMGSQFKQKELELQAIQTDLKKMELDMAKKKSRAIYEPYPSYPSFSTIPAPLFPSSPTSYPYARHKETIQV
ncbi:hypothetical protein K1719_021130 [Acacia pycnantha]|nr:hypothetical protein K1719_021130 [Acacia pycnantha]